MAESITEGTLKQWLKQEGDFVEADEEVATIETDKVRPMRTNPPRFQAEQKRMEPGTEGRAVQEHGTNHFVVHYRLISPSTPPRLVTFVLTSLPKTTPSPWGKTCSSLKLAPHPKEVSYGSERASLKLPRIDTAPLTRASQEPRRRRHQRRRLLLLNPRRTSPSPHQRRTLPRRRLLLQSLQSRAHLNPHRRRPPHRKSPNLLRSLARETRRGCVRRDLCGSYSRVGWSTDNYLLMDNRSRCRACANVSPNA